MRIVLDTSVVVSAFRSPAGASAKILQLVFSREITLCLDYKMICEYRDVTTRPEHRKASGLSVRQISDLLSVLEDMAEPVQVRRRFRNLSPDPADDMVLEAAINAEADAIVTHNLRHLELPGSQFGILVVTPAEFLGRRQKGVGHANS